MTTEDVTQEAEEFLVGVEVLDDLRGPERLVREILADPARAPELTEPLHTIFQIAQPDMERWIRGQTSQVGHHLDDHALRAKVNQIFGRALEILLAQLGALPAKNGGTVHQPEFSDHYPSILAWLITIAGRTICPEGVKKYGVLANDKTKARRRRELEKEHHERQPTGRVDTPSGDNVSTRVELDRCCRRVEVGVREGKVQPRAAMGFLLRREAARGPLTEDGVRRCGRVAHFDGKSTTDVVRRHRTWARSRSWRGPHWLTRTDLAVLLDISERTVQRDWGSVLAFVVGGGSP